MAQCHAALRRVDSSARSLAGATGLVSSITPPWRSRCSTSGPVAPDTSTASASGCRRRVGSMTSMPSLVAGQLQVAQHHVEVRAAGAQPGERLGAGGGAFDLAAPLFEQRAAAVEDGRIVVHHEAAQAGQRRRRHAARARAAPLRAASRAGSSSAKVLPACSAERSGDARAEQGRDARADREAEAEALATVALGVRDLVELLEDARLVDRRDADAVVAHLDAHGAAAARRAATSTVPSGGVWRIALADQVADDALQQRGIAAHRQAAVAPTAAARAPRRPARRAARRAGRTRAASDTPAMVGVSTCASSREISSRSSSSTPMNSVASCSRSTAGRCAGLAVGSRPSMNRPMACSGWRRSWLAAARKRARDKRRLLGLGHALQRDGGGFAHALLADLAVALQALGEPVDVVREVGQFVLRASSPGSASPRRRRA